MKRCLSVILMLCLLMSAAASAFAEKKVYQDDLAPELVAVTDAQGVESAALIKDAQGNVIATIPMDGLLKTVCVGQRDEEHPEIEDLLHNSLITIMEDEHVTNAPWLIETDLFYTEIPEAYAGYLADGALAEMTFDPHILEEGDELLVLVSADGETWTEAPSVSFKGDGTVSVGINQSGVMAFLIEHHDFYTVYETTSETIVTPTTVTVTEETNPNFTPSVSGKLAPEVVTFEVEGEPCVATIITTTGEVVDVITNQNWMVVTPLSERVYNPDVITYEHLVWAYDTISAAASIGGLPTEGLDGALGDEIDGMLAANNSGLSHADLTVSDLFEITVYGQYLQYLNEGSGNLLEVTFDTDMEQDDTLIVLCASGVNGWHVVDEENVIINEDGTVTLRMRHVGVVTFLVEKADQVIDANAADTVTAP